MEQYCQLLIGSQSSSAMQKRDHVKVVFKFAFFPEVLTGSILEQRKDLPKLHNTKPSTLKGFIVEKRKDLPKPHKTRRSTLKTQEIMIVVVDS